MIRPEDVKITAIVNLKDVDNNSSVLAKAGEVLIEHCEENGVDLDSDDGYLFELILRHKNTSVGVEAEELEVADELDGDM